MMMIIPPRYPVSEVMKSATGMPVGFYFPLRKNLNKKIKGMENEKNLYKISKRNDRSKSSRQYRNFVH